MSSPETRVDDPAPQGDGESKPKLNLDIRVESKGACQRHVTVTVSREDVDRYFDEAYTELMPDAAVPGFRSGRAPRKLVESRYRQEVTRQVKGSLLMDSLDQVTEEADFAAISEPDLDFDAIELAAESPLTFEFDIEVRPEFELPDWKGLKLQRPTREFTADDIDRHLQKLLGRRGTLMPVDGAADAGDFVVLDLKFRHDGKLVSQCSEQTVPVAPTLSFPDGNLEGFDKLMLGARAGDHRDAQLTVSHDAANEQLRGEDVQADIEVLEVKRRKLPEMDAALLEELGGFDSEGDLRDAIQDELQRRLGYHQQRRVRQQISELLTESADWELPPDLLRRQARRELERAVLELRSAGFGEEEIRAHENELRQNSMASTETALKEHFILEEIAEQEQITDEPQDYDDEIARIARQAGEPVRRVRARIEKQGMMDSLRNQIIERKVIDLITKHAKFKDVPYEPDQKDTAAVQHVISGVKESVIPAAKPGGEAEDLAQRTGRTERS
jgi:trigger factor